MAGYKVWAHREVLEAAEVNGFLMSQSVPRFFSAAERSAAIADPGPGQLSYVSSVGVQIFSGGDWVNLIPSGGGGGDVPVEAMLFYGEWNPGTAYEPNHVVLHEGGTYVAVLASNGVNPTITPGYWECIGPPSAMRWAGPWDNGTVYRVGAVVTDAGGLFISVADTVSDTPASSPSSWATLSAT